MVYICVLGVRYIVCAPNRVKNTMCPWPNQIIYPLLSSRVFTDYCILISAVTFYLLQSFSWSFSGHFFFFYKFVKFKYNIILKGHRERNFSFWNRNYNNWIDIYSIRVDKLQPTGQIQHAQFIVHSTTYCTVYAYTYFKCTLKI